MQKVKGAEGVFFILCGDGVSTARPSASPPGQASAGIALWVAPATQKFKVEEVKSEHLEVSVERGQVTF